MPPHTTYLRITPQSVLQLRIFTDQPLDAGPRWLLHPTDPALPKIVDEIRPLILPKLREENLRKYGAKSGRGSGGAGRTASGVRGKKRVKDVVSTDEFEVAVFLTELPTRHSLLVKHKIFQNSGKRKLSSNTTKLTDALDGDGNADGNDEDPVVIRQESPSSSAEAVAALGGIPEARTNKRPKRADLTGDESQVDDAEVISSDEDESPNLDQVESAEDEKKKKPNFKTSYDGYSIWGWVLVLLVTRKDKGLKKGVGGTSATVNDSMMGLSDTSTSQKGDQGGLMEEWISTQAAGEADLEEDVDGD